jgi:hypothetical protein
LFYFFAESNLLHISPVHKFPCQGDNYFPGESYLITSTSNECPSFELQAIDTLECTRFHGDSLPEGISEENVVEVRELLAHDYAQSFQVFNYNLTPHNFSLLNKCPLISRMQEDVPHLVCYKTTKWGCC